MENTVVVAGDRPLCTSCGYMLYVRWDMIRRKFVADHSEIEGCPNSEKTFIVPVEKLPACQEAV